jgi:hypothetical protein
MNKVRGIFLVGIVLALISCEKEEPLYKLDVVPSDSKEMIITMGGDYSNQIFVDLETSNTYVNDFKVWDIALPSDLNKLNIRINDANASYLTSSTFNNMNMEEDLPVSGWEIDKSCGSSDSCAIGEWYIKENSKYRSKKLVYIIDRGELSTGGRYYKFQILEKTEDSYKVAFGLYNSTKYMVKTIVIDENKNYNYFNLDKGTIEEIEHFDKDKWDLVFRPYRHVFLDQIPVLQYVVVGSLINPNKVKVYECTDVDYNDIDLEFATSSLDYSSDWDVIGFDWKEFDRNTNKYSVRSNLSYVIQDSKGVYYKLRFISFYNELGEKGFPKFEFKRL